MSCECGHSIGLFPLESLEEVLEVPRAARVHQEVAKETPQAGHLHRTQRPDQAAPLVLLHPLPLQPLLLAPLPLLLLLLLLLDSQAEVAPPLLCRAGQWLLAWLPASCQEGGDLGGKL